MSSQAFLWVQILVGSALLMLFLWRRSQRQPTRLHMRNGEAGKSSTHPNIPAHRPRTAARHGARAQGISAEVLQATTVGAEKSLNVLFNHNGHTWDAYEILGIPAGAPSALVDSAYRSLLAKTAPESRDFVEAAYQAIKTGRAS